MSLSPEGLRSAWNVSLDPFHVQPFIRNVKPKLWPPGALRSIVRGMHTNAAKRLRVNPDTCRRCPSGDAVHALGMCFRCYQRNRRGSLPAVNSCSCGESDIRALSAVGQCWNCVAKAG